MLKGLSGSLTSKMLGCTTIALGRFLLGLLSVQTINY